VSIMNTSCIQMGAQVAETGLRIRVDDTLRRDFIEICKLNDTTAAQVLRACMRSYLEEHAPSSGQGQLFGMAISSLADGPKSLGRPA
jgi:hypothetical protein